jgi:hypothetical protein
MALDDFFESEVAIAAGLTAAAMSPNVRRVMRRGAVLGLAGIMTAGDTVAGVARGAVREAQASRNGGGADGSSAEGRARRSSRARSGT